MPKPVILRSVSFIWGLAEATFFFLVPDIWLSRIAVLGSLREAFINSFFAMLGALVGGCILYALAEMAFPVVEGFLLSIPAISAAMVSQASADMAGNSFVQVLSMGAISGVPYKIYATLAGHFSVPLIVFLLATVFARLWRFMLVVLLYHVIAARLRRFAAVVTIHAVYVFSWLIFYAGYFAVFAAGT